MYHLLESMVFMMSVRDDTTSNFGKPSQIASTACLLVSGGFVEAVIIKFFLAFCS